MEKLRERPGTEAHKSRHMPGTGNHTGHIPGVRQRGTESGSA